VTGLISVIVTTYGTNKWKEIAAKRAIPSIKELEPYELIVHHEEKMQIGPARNRAAAKATGEWLLFVDADDELDVHYLEAMTDAICAAERPEPALLQPAVRYCRQGSKSMTPIIIPQKDLRHDNYLVIGTVLRRNLFKKVKGFNDYPHGFEDWSLWAKCWKAGATVYPVPEAIYNAHINPQSQHRTMWRNRKLQVETHLRIQAELFPEDL
jgi:glycosyltransferase involved in cell wall biosynthesis